MARMNPQALREIIIDGMQTEIPERATIDQVVSPQVHAITTLDPETGRTHLISRDRFDQAVPAGFLTHLTPISKG